MKDRQRRSTEYRRKRKAYFRQWMPRKSRRKRKEGRENE